MEQLNPQSVIDELSKRLQQVTLENVVLSARLNDLIAVLQQASQQQTVDTQEVTVIGEQPQE